MEKFPFAIGDRVMCDRWNAHEGPRFVRGTIIDLELNCSSAIIELDDGQDPEGWCTKVAQWRWDEIRPLTVLELLGEI